jgi:hypothetical protein
VAAACSIRHYRFQCSAVFGIEAEHSWQCLDTISLFVSPNLFRKGNIAWINIEQINTERL